MSNEELRAMVEKKMAEAYKNGNYFIKVRLTFAEEVLGMMPSNDDVYAEYIAGKAPDAKTSGDEASEFSFDEEVQKGTTVFPRLADGTPYIYDYQIRGFFKDSAGLIRQAKTGKSETEKLKAYKKVIDGCIFIKDRKNPFSNYEEITRCERPLRAETMQGPRVALAASEALPALTQLEFTIQLRNKNLRNAVIEWLDYGAFHGMGQWRNSGKGKFVYEILAEGEEP